MSICADTSGLVLESRLVPDETMQPVGKMFEEAFSKLQTLNPKQWTRCKEALESIISFNRRLWSHWKSLPHVQCPVDPEETDIAGLQYPLLIFSHPVMFLQ